MSKQALALLARNMGEDVLGDTWQGSTKEGFRQKNLDYKPQYVLDSTVGEIEAQIRTQISLLDQKNGTDYYSQLDDVKAFTEAANIFLTNFNNSFTEAEKAAAKGADGVIAVVNNYDGLSKRRLIPAEKKAKEYLQNVLNGDLGDKTRLFSPDHSFPAAEIRFSRALYNAVSIKNPELTNPQDIQDAGKKVLADLANVSLMGRPVITQATYDYFVDAFVKITSRFTGGLSQKTFDIEFGAEIAPRSQLDNELHGRQVQNYTKELAKAAANIVGKTNWAAQDSSDSYVTAVMKQLNNAVVKSGGSGKIQSISSEANTSQVNKRLKGTQSVDKVKLGTRNAPSVSKKSQKPLISMENLVKYINSRLPEAVLNNMGPDTLVNRTGRFASSVRLTGAEQTKQGYTTLVYSYLRSPYDVFDPTLGRKPWNIPSRDPNQIIKKSVRDIARDLAIGRFYMRRA